MEVKVAQRLLPQFVLDGETLKDLDAVLHQHADEHRGAPTVTYTVRRRDGITYTTSNVEEVSSEPNGAETGLTSLVANYAVPPRLSLRLLFDGDVKVEAEGEDRALAALLVADLRTVTRDRAKPRPFHLRFSTRAIIGLGAAVVAVIIFGWFGDRNRDERFASWEREIDAARATELAADEKEEAESARRAAEREREAKWLIRRGSPDQKMDFLLRLLTELPPARTSAPRTSPDLEDPPWVFDTPITYALIPVAAQWTTFALLMWLVPRRSIFLIGQEVDRYKKHLARRDKVVWGIAVAFVVGLVTEWATS